MLESLGRIQNPFVRSLTAATTVGSVVTLTAAVAIGVAKAKDESAHRFEAFLNSALKASKLLLKWDERVLSSDTQSHS